MSAAGARLGVRDLARMLALSVRMLAGRRFWLAPLLPLVWIGCCVFAALVGWTEEDYSAAEAQNLLLAFPLVLLAVGLGVRVIAGEIDRRTIEIAYTVPGGAHRVWLAKLATAFGILVAGEGLAAGAAYLFCTEFPPGALYGALQGATVYLALAMALSALFRSEAAGALVTSAVLAFNWLVQGGNPRISPFFNPLNLPDADPTELLAWTVQNRIGMALALAALVALAFGRAENREALLRG